MDASEEAIAKVLADPQTSAGGIWAVNLQGQQLSSWHAYAVLRGKIWHLPALSNDVRYSRCPSGVHDASVITDTVPRIELQAQDGAEAFICQKPNGDTAVCDGSDNQGEPVQSFCAYGSYTITSYLLDPKTFTVLAVVEESGVDSDARVAAHSLVQLNLSTASIEVTGADCHLKEPLPAAPHPG